MNPLLDYKAFLDKKIPSAIEETQKLFPDYRPNQEKLQQHYYSLVEENVEQYDILVSQINTLLRELKQEIGSCQTLEHKKAILQKVLRHKNLVGDVENLLN